VKNHQLMEEKMIIELSSFTIKKLCRQSIDNWDISNSDKQCQVGKHTKLLGKNYYFFNDKPIAN
jgi:hypothetical protein